MTDSNENFSKFLCAQSGNDVEYALNQVKVPSNFESRKRLKDILLIILKKFQDLTKRLRRRIERLIFTLTPEAEREAKKEVARESKSISKQTELSVKAVHSQGNPEKSF